MLSLLFAIIPVVSSMTIEEKVGQTLMVTLHGEAPNEAAKALIQEMHVGGIIYYNWANGLTSPEQVQHLSNGLQKLAPIPLFIACDQEGGKVARLKEGFTHFSSIRSLGIYLNPDFIEQYAIATSQECKAVGVNFILAPVADIATHPDSFMKARSAGVTAEKVVSVLVPLLSGYQKEKLITSLKHFPGHGDTSVDSHTALPVVAKSKAELLQCELLPYKRLAQVADTIMTAHILVPSLDPQNIATLSPTVLQDVLRKELDFKGVIISDSLVMQAVFKQCPSIEEAAVSAFKAGCDILLLGGKVLVGSEKRELTVSDIKRIANRLIQAVESGEISEEQLNESVERILDLKKRYDLDSQPLPTEEDIKKFVATLEHQPFRLTAIDLLNQMADEIKERQHSQDKLSSIASMIRNLKG